ncbi:MAG TPA: OsmC family protein [Bdellovibrionales bacterium]|nr:OsmC family protein [Bdellovibrionales bacterium]
MGVEMSVVYQGEKHCELTHGPSGSLIETDAPRDNAGRGERFSPTDLVGAALASCVLTTMAILGERNGLDLRGMKARVLKEMIPNPRKIARLPVDVDMPAGLAPEDRKKLEAAAHTCPVHRSLASDVDAPITFNYPD